MSCQLLSVMANETIKSESQSGRSRMKGRFCTKRKLQWRENIIAAHKKRRIANQAAAEFNNPNLTGRRLIDLHVLAEELWCKTCNAPTSLRHVTGESRMGLASILHVTCQLCQLKYQVHTSKTEKSTGFSHPPYTVNTEIINGTLQSGLGLRDLNNILSAAKVPILNHSLYNRYVKNAGKSIDSLDDKGSLENSNIESLDDKGSLEKSNIEWLDDKGSLENSNIVWLDDKGFLENSNIESLVVKSSEEPLSSEDLKTEELLISKKEPEFSAEYKSVDTK